MTADLDIATSARQQLVRTLVDKGALRTSDWIVAFRAVPRHSFVSRFSLLGRDGGTLHHDLGDPARRDAAMAAVYTDRTLITRWDEGGTPTSSSSTPSLMGTMLEALDVRPGHRVLEIGTGTGYNAALLTHRLGDNAVTTIDLDPDLVLLANLSIGLARLVAQGDGSARGHFLSETAAFMAMRATADHRSPTGGQIIDATSGPGTARTDRLPDGLRSRSFTFLLSFAMPTVELVTMRTGTATTHRLLDTTSRSWVRAETTTDDRADVTYDGPRDLWAEIQDLTDTWDRAGRPEHQCYGLDVTTTGRHVLWLDDPSTPVWSD